MTNKKTKKVRIKIMMNNNEKMESFELNDEELMDVNGGNWFTDAWNATCDWVSENKRAVIGVTCIVGGIALCATGIGIGALAGVVAVESTGAAAVVATGVGTVIGAGASAAINGDEE